MIVPNLRSTMLFPIHTYPKASSEYKLGGKTETVVKEELSNILSLKHRNLVFFKRIVLSVVSARRFWLWVTETMQMKALKCYFNIN